MTATVQALSWSLPHTTATLVSFGAVDRLRRNVGAVFAPYEAEILPLTGPWSDRPDHLGRRPRIVVVEPALVGTTVAMLWFQAARWSDPAVVPGKVPFALAWRMAYGASNRERMFVGAAGADARDTFVKEYLANGRKRAIKAHGFAPP